MHGMCNHYTCMNSMCNHMHGMCKLYLEVPSCITLGLRCTGKNLSSLPGERVTCFEHIGSLTILPPLETRFLVTIGSPAEQLCRSIVKWHRRAGRRAALALPKCKTCDGKSGHETGVCGKCRGVPTALSRKAGGARPVAGGAGVGAGVVHPNPQGILGPSSASGCPCVSGWAGGERKGRLPCGGQGRPA